MLAHPHYQASDKARILEEETYKQFGYYPKDLTLKSNEKIVMACDSCGKIRKTQKYNYRALCHSCSLKGRYPTAASRKKMSEAQKRIYVDRKSPMFGKHHTKETKQKISKANKGRLLGENSPHWKGGLSFEPYCLKFNNDFKAYIRAKFGNVCFLCGKTVVANGRGT